MSDQAGKIYQQLSAYLDGELDEAARSQVESMIDQQPGLGDELRRLGRVRELVRSLPRQKVSDDFADEVLAKAERMRLVTSSDTTPTETPLSWVRYIATAAVLFIAVGVGAIVSVMLWSTSQYNRDAEPVLAVDDSVSSVSVEVEEGIAQEPHPGEPVLALRSVMPTASQARRESYVAGAAPLDAVPQLDEAPTLQDADVVADDFINYARRQVSQALADSGVVAQELEETNIWIAKPSSTCRS